MDILCIEGALHMTMHINLSPEMEGFIKAKVATGFYGNATEVIRDAVRRMQAEEAHSAAFRAAVKIGDEELDRGLAREYTPAVLEEITRKALKDMHSGKPIDPDVLP
jgi:antitoxin ParD1/3/4